MRESQQRTAAPPRASGNPIRALIQTALADLQPSPQRWRRAARIAFITAAGAGLMGAFQIVNPLGLTLLLSLAAPETAFGLGTAAIFLISAAGMQLLMLAIAGAVATAPLLQLLAFAGYVAATSYAIYGLPQFGRLWLWVQIPTATAFYLVIFQHDSLGEDNLDMFAGLTVAIALLLCFNHLIWPQPAAEVLRESMEAYLARSRRRLAALISGYLVGDPADAYDRPAASRLSYHLTLLKPATHNPGARQPWYPLAGVLGAERIHHRVERIAALIGASAQPELREEQRARLRAAAAEIEAGIGGFLENLRQAGGEHGRSTSMAAARRELAAVRGEIADLPGPGGGIVVRLLAELDDLCGLLEMDSRDFPGPAAVSAPPPSRSAAGFDRFLMRFSLRHTLAMTIVFVVGLADNTAALHAGLWLLMIGGPPSHGATVRKFTVRAIGAAGALTITALATLVIAPNFTGPVSYMAAIFIGVLPIVYVGEGGGLFGFLAIGATAFVIAFSGPGPRTEIIGSLWTIWGISFGMIVRAGVSLLWPEYAPRTLVEEFQPPLAALAKLVPQSAGEAEDPAAIALRQGAVTRGVEELLAVAVDAHLEGRNPDIDPANLIDVLDTMHRLALQFGNMRPSDSPPGERFNAALRARFESWGKTLARQKDAHRMVRAPLRMMVQDPNVPSLVRPLREIARLGKADGRFAAAAAQYYRATRRLAELQRQFSAVSRH